MAYPKQTLFHCLKMIPKVIYWRLIWRPKKTLPVKHRVTNAEDRFFLGLITAICLMAAIATLVVLLLRLWGIV